MIQPGLFPKASYATTSAITSLLMGFALTKNKKEKKKDHTSQHRQEKQRGMELAWRSYKVQHPTPKQYFLHS